MRNSALFQVAGVDRFGNLTKEIFTPNEASTMKIPVKLSMHSLGLALLCLFCYCTTAKAGLDNSSFPLRITAFEGFEALDLGISIDWQPFNKVSFGYIYNLPQHSAEVQGNELHVFSARYWPLPSKIPVYAGLGLMKTGGFDESLTIPAGAIDKGSGTATPGNYTASVTVEPNVAPAWDVGALAVTSLWGYNLVFWGAMSYSLSPRDGQFTFVSDNPKATSKDLEMLKASYENVLKNDAMNSQGVISQIGVGFAF